MKKIINTSKRISLSQTDFVKAFEDAGMRITKMTKTDDPYHNFGWWPGDIYYQTCAPVKGEPRCDNPVIGGKPIDGVNPWHCEECWTKMVEHHKMREKEKELFLKMMTKHIKN